MFDDYPELPDFLNRKCPASHWLTEIRQRTRGNVMKPETETAVTETAEEAPAPKVKAPKAKKAKANGANGKHKVVKAKGGKKAERAARTRDPAKLDEYGFRKGSIKSRSAALYKKGATLADVKEAVGSVQFNVLTELKAKGFEVKETTIKGQGGRDATKYKIVAKSK